MPPATFQRLMQTAFREEMFSILWCYLNDFALSQTISEHIRRLDTVFTRLSQYGVKLELRKCDFFQWEVKYLGNSVLAEGIDEFRGSRFCGVMNYRHFYSDDTCFRRVRLWFLLL